MVAPGVVKGGEYEWRQPALHALFLGSVKARGGLRDAMRPFSKKLMLAVCFLSLANGMEWRGEVEF